MIRLNLLPDIKRDYQKAKRAQARVISGSIVAMLVAGGAVVALALFIYGGQKLYTAWLTQSIKDSTAEIQKITDIDKYVTIQNQLANLSSLHDNKNDFSRLMNILPSLNPKSPNNIKLSSVELDDAMKSIIFEGSAVDFTGLVTFRDILVNSNIGYRVGSDANAEVITEKLFSEVVIIEQAMSRGSDGTQTVTFKISVNYNQTAFLSSSRDVSVSVPKLETTQSKQDSPDLFTAPTQEGN